MTLEHRMAALVKQVNDLLATVEGLQTEISSEHRALLAAEAEGERQNTMFAFAIHELRTPLTTILGFATTLLATDVMVTEAEQHEFMLIIAEEAERMRVELERFVELVRSKVPGTFISVAPVPVERILQIAHPQLMTLVQAHELKIELAEVLPPVLADPQRISQVIVNLIKNAVHYSPAATPIIVRAQPLPAEVLIEVIDQGPGIPQDARERIFEPFRQLLDINVSGDGLGMGLAISKAIVTAHNGKIWADTLDGAGARMCFTLPAFLLPGV
jgi:signal transduction histidine kinase